MSLRTPYARLSLAASVGAATFAAAYVLHRFRRLYNYWHAEFVEAGRVEGLYLYPLKSGKCVETSYLDCTERGGRNGWLGDREFLVVDELNDHMFLTARAYPRMVLIGVAQDGNTVTIKFPDEKTIHISLVEVKERHDVRRAILHKGKSTDGLDCGDEIGSALTDFLEVQNKRNLRLLRYDPTLFTERDQQGTDDLWINPVPHVQDRIMYADMTSYMAMTSASMVRLNEKLAEIDENPVGIGNFRPTIFIRNELPFAEDYWLHIRIGDAEFVCFRACARCVLTTVDPARGVKRPNMQPLRRLRDFRLAPNELRMVYKDAPIFGVHMALVRPGRIRVGDTVFVQLKSSPL